MWYVATTTLNSVISEVRYIQCVAIFVASWNQLSMSMWHHKIEMQTRLPLLALLSESSR